MNNYTDELFLKEVGKIARKYNGEVMYGNILTRQFWVDCPEEFEEIISFEIKALIAEFRTCYYNFENEKVVTVEGWPINIGELR